MKFSKLSQLFLVSMIGLAAAALLAGCQIVTIDYVFVADSAGTSSSSNGQIQTFDADSQSGALRSGQPSVPSGGSNPVSMTVSSDYANLYVANQGTGSGNGNVVHFAIDGNGVLTQKDVVTPSTPPVAVAVNAAITYLFVVSGTNSATLSVYPLSSGAIGAAASPVTLTVPGYAGDTMVPTGVFALANNNAVYVTAYDQSAYNPGGSTSSTANPGWIFGFGVGSGGALTPAAGSPWKAGVKPSGLVADPTSRFLYATDFASNQLIGYTIQSGDVLSFLINGPFPTGNEPSAVTIDPRGKYMYVTNALDSSVSGFTIDLATGTPTKIVNVIGAAVNSTDTDPVAIVVDPALARVIYTANRLGDSVSGFRLDPDTGAASPTQATPYPTAANPTAIAAIPHGNHANQVTTP
jgi:6-phosphogluconolactonase (cycloisomerase 2 family)